MGAAVCGARKANGSDHKLVIQMNANGVTFEAYPSLKGKDAQVYFFTSACRQVPCCFKLLE